MPNLDDCRLCPRLVNYRIVNRNYYPFYHNNPVAPFGATDSRLLIVGLAPGLHGANATGRPFTGDASGDLLFEALHKRDFSSLPLSRGIDDGMILRNCRITNAVKCVPPKNRPLASEINTCKGFLTEEISELVSGSVILALGVIAHRAVINAFGLRQSDYRFAHCMKHDLPQSIYLIDSIHPSRYNQQTGKIDSVMLDQVLSYIGRLLD